MIPRASLLSVRRTALAFQSRLALPQTLGNATAAAAGARDEFSSTTVSGTNVCRDSGPPKKSFAQSISDWWNSGKNVPLGPTEGELMGAEDTGPAVSKGVSWETRRPKNPTRKFTEDGSAFGVSAGASHDWERYEGAYKRWGDEQSNFQLGSYGYGLTSGVGKTKDGWEANFIKASGHAEVASAQTEGYLVKDVLKGHASGKVLSAEGDLSLGAEWTNKAREVRGKVGGSLDIAKGEVGFQLEIPLWGGHKLLIGGTAEGQIGASAEAKAGLGWNEKDGYYIGAKAKAGFGLGGGLGFSLGFK
jgi:hypothetical protein